jgi:hypothetical protein
MLQEKTTLIEGFMNDSKRLIKAEGRRQRAEGII